MSAQTRVLAPPTAAGLLGLLLAAAVGASGTLAAEAEQCTVTVDPAVAPAGTQFTVSGAGFSPTHLTLRAAAGRETTVALDLGGADPFTIPVGSNVGDEGAWTATVYVDGTACRASADFIVSLLGTSDVAVAGRRAHLTVPLPVVALVALFGLAGGVLLARRLRLA